MRGAAAAPLFFPSSGRRPRIGASPSYSRAVQRRPEGEFEAQWWFQHTTQGDAAVLPCLIRSAADAHPTLPWRLRPRRTLLVPGCISPWFIYTLLSLGIIMCLLTYSGHIATETANRPCLSCHVIFVFLLVILEAAIAADVFLNSYWEEVRSTSAAIYLLFLCVF
ncbi:hypothetical protein ACQJBY_070173 [Aegilops geniculata]